MLLAANIPFPAPSATVLVLVSKAVYEGPSVVCFFTLWEASTYRSKPAPSET